VLEAEYNPEFDHQKELNKDEIVRLLHKVDDVLRRRNQKAIIYVVGGANVALTIDARRVTTDVDVVVKKGMEQVISAAREVSLTEPELTDHWLNAAFTGETYDSGITWQWFDYKDRDAPDILFSGNALSVELASPEMILALKTLAARDKDMQDIFKLMRWTGIKTRQQLGDNVRRFTGNRIFETQEHWSNPIHIRERMADIYDQLPPDLRSTWGSAADDKRKARTDRKNRKKLEQERAKEAKAIDGVIYSPSDPKELRAQRRAVKAAARQEAKRLKAEEKRIKQQASRCPFVTAQTRKPCILKAGHSSSHRSK